MTPVVSASLAVVVCASFRAMDDDKADELISALQNLSSKFDDSSFFSSPQSIYDLLEDIRDRLVSMDSTLESIKDALESD